MAAIKPRIPVDQQRFVDELFSIIQGYTDKRIGHLATLLEAIQKHLDAQPNAAATESLERRISRNSEHLNRIEDRLKRAGL